MKANSRTTTIARVSALLLVVLLFVSACAPLQSMPADGGSATPEAVGEPPAESAPEGAAGDVVTLYVGPRKVECMGVAPMQCLQVKDAPEGEYENFFSGIDGFVFVPGYTYELRVRTFEIPNPPADDSSIGYTLEEVVSKEPAYSGEAMALAGTEWRLVAFGEEQIVQYDPAVTTVNIIFGEDGSVSGTSGCNQYGGSYTLEGDTLGFGPLMSTLMACEEPAMSVEAAYLDALGSASTFTIRGNMLEIVYAAGLLTFETAVPQ